MSIFEAIFLGVVQGVTEFLPISSSGHLIVAETLLGLHVDGLKDFDVALHVGTLLAILVYFRKDLLHFKWWPWLILGSIPAALVGFTLEDQIDALFRGASSVAIMMIIVGLLFFIPQRHEDRPLTWWRALLMGCGQAVAIIPGVSRSGASIFTGMQLGLKREEAARFSFLLGSIAIGGAGLLKALDTTELTIPSHILLAALVSAFFSSLLVASWLMKFLKKHSFRAFGIYRVIFGISLLLLFNFYTGDSSSSIKITDSKQGSLEEISTPFPIEELIFVEGKVSVLDGAYTGLAFSFEEETPDGLVEFHFWWPSTEEFSVYQRSEMNPAGERIWWIEAILPELPYTFDQSAFEGLTSTRLPVPVTPDCYLRFESQNGVEILRCKSFEVTLNEFVIKEEKITLKGHFLAESDGLKIGGDLNFKKTPLGRIDIE